MKKLIGLIGLLALLWSGTAFGDSGVRNASAAEERCGLLKLEGATASIWGCGTNFQIYGSIGPVFDMRDPAYGYSATVGFNLHWRYFGIALDVTWNSLWAVDAKRSDHNDTSYHLTNTIGMLMARGYIPVTDEWIVTIGAGIGVGHQYGTPFSDEDFTESGTSWMARLLAGVLYRFENQLTLGFDIQFNFGRYCDVPLVGQPYWSDHAIDYSAALVFSVGYDFHSD